jgi:hypothetical protein
MKILENMKLMKYKMNNKKNMIVIMIMFRKVLKVH